MDETAKLSHNYPQQNNDETEFTDSTAHDIFLVVQDEGDTESLRIVQLEPDRGEVTSLGKIPYLDWQVVMVFCAGYIFCLGDWDWSGFVYAFDLFKRTAWTPTRLMEPVSSAASAASGHEFIVSGGEKKSGNTVATCSVYAPATNRWTSMRQLRQPRRLHRMCWLPDGRVFAIGGLKPEIYVQGGYHLENLSSVEMLERAWIPVLGEDASAEWQYVAPMNTGRYGFGSGVVEGRIVVAGGCTVEGHEFLSVESFEPPTATNIGQWTSLTDLASNMGFCCLVPSAAGLLLMNENGEMQFGRRKAKLVSSSEWEPWTWENRPRLTVFEYCWGLVSLPSTVDASQI